MENTDKTKDNKFKGNELFNDNSSTNPDQIYKMFETQKDTNKSFNNSIKSITQMIKDLIDLSEGNNLSIKETRKKIDLANSAIKTQNEKVENIKKNINDLKEETEKQKEETEKQKYLSIELLTIFVSIFTFISVEIQIMKYVDDYLRIAGLSLIFFSGLLLFLCSIYLFLNKTRTNDFILARREYWLLIICVIFCLLGILLTGLGDWKNPASIKNSPDFIELENKNRLLEQKMIKVESDLSLPG